MMPRRNVIAVSCVALTAMLLGEWLLASDRSWAAGRKVVNTRFVQLVFSSDKDIRRFNNKIDFATGSGFGSFFSTPSDAQVEKELIRKVDALFIKVQRILDMRKKIRKVRVNIYSNREELHQAYYKIFKRKCTIRGWYLFERNTVYLQVEDVYEGMLAHELAHAIIDHYLTVRPPRASAEILARYVDDHLFDEVEQF